MADLQKWLICRKTSYSTEDTPIRKSVLLPLDAIPIGQVENKTYLGSKTTMRPNGEKESCDRFKIESTVIYIIKKEIVDVVRTVQIK